MKQFWLELACFPALIAIKNRCFLIENERKMMFLSRFKG
jgi:hypothetical protein